MHESGTVSIVGRSKDMIVRGGENVLITYKLVLTVIINQVYPTGNSKLI